MMTPWAPAPADPLRVTILAALADRALTYRDGYPRRGLRQLRTRPLLRGPPGDLDLADQFEDAYMQVAVGSAAWCDLAVKLISEMN